MDKGQTRSKNRTLTHNLQQPVREANPPPTRPSNSSLWQPGQERNYNLPAISPNSQDLVSA